MASLLEKILSGITTELDTELSTPANTESSSIPTPSFSSKAMSGEVWSDSQESSQVIQISPLPLTLNLSDFKNALSNANPEGDMFAAQKFQQLVDPAPRLTTEYMTSPSSIEEEYGGIVNGASAPIESTYLTSMIANAKRNFETSGQADFVSHGEWRLIEAVPTDWYTDDPTRYSKVKISLDGNESSTSSLNLLGDKLPPTTLTLGNKQVSLSKTTNFTHCELEYMLVRFIRPWMDFTLFKTDGWWLAGQQPGYCSSGKRDVNSGILPLITTGMIIAKSAKFEGNWDPKDQKMIDDFRKTDDDVYIGPYRLSDESKPVSTVSVVAWISELVPLSPQLEGAATSGTVNFRNEGVFKTKCIVKWEINGEQMNTKSLVTKGNSDKITIPNKATNVIVVIRAPERSDEKVIFRKKYSTLSNKSYVIKGTLENTQVEEE